MRRLLLAFVFVALSFAFVRPVQALPEIYVGAGVHQFGMLGSTASAHSLAVGAGVDDLLKGLGVGVNAYVPGENVVVNADLRYSLFKVPFLRVYAGIGAGTQRTTSKIAATTVSSATETSGWGAVFEGFIGARVSVGTYFAGLDIGAARWADVQPYGTLTVGLTL